MDTVSWQFRRAWTIKPVATPDVDETLLAGVEDAALFMSVDDGATWMERHTLRHHPSHADWEPGAAGCCLHTIVTHPGGCLPNALQAPNPSA